MKIKYWTDFSKRKNSTLRPNDLQATEIDIRLKDDCSVINPVIQSSTIPINANYFYIPDFGRYYFLDNTERTSQQLKDHSTEVDVLATYKDYIGSTVARIAFSSTGWNKDIVDSRLGVITTKIKYERSAATELTQAGCYVITAYNNDSSSASNGMATSYVMTAAELRKFKAFVGDTTIYQNLKNYFKGEPLESVYGAIWVPFDYAKTPGAAVSNIKVGDQSSIGSGYSITAYELSGTGRLDGTEITLEIPYRYNDFRDIAPFSTAQLYLPGAGKVDLNLADWLDTVNIKITYTMEYATGDLTYYIRDINGYLIQTVSCNVASQCPLGQTSGNGGGLLSASGGAALGIGGIIGGAITGNVVAASAGAASLLTSAASFATSANMHATSLKGNVGGRTSTEIRNVIITVYDIDTEDCDSDGYIATKGRPVAITHAISNHSGYVQCDDASVSMPGTATEKDRVNSYLNSGFFYE